MKILKTQFGVSSHADYSKREWTFEMPKEYTVVAGEFAIVDKSLYKRLVKALAVFKDAIQGHPDSVAQSQLAFTVKEAEEVLNKLTTEN